MRHRCQATEEFFGYDPLELEKWVSDDPAVSKAAVLARTAVCGDLGRSANTFVDQAARKKGVQNFPEVVYACHLAKQGYPQDGLMYETYALSMKALREHEGEKMAKNALKLREVLADAFLLAFDTLCDRNPTHVGTKSRAGMIVDLLAVDPVKRKIGIYEIKKYAPMAKKSEKVQPHQLFVLVAANHLFTTMGAAAFVGAPCTVETKLISFATQQDLRLGRMTPTTYDIEISS